MSTINCFHGKPFVRSTYAMLLTCLVVSVAATSLSLLRLALLPIALVFGWIQIGGL